MPALNFQDRFADLVASGLKPHTIRRPRKNPIKPGQTLYLYRGMRTPLCRRLRQPLPCLQVTPIQINSTQRSVILGPGSLYYPHHEETILSDPETLTLALRDGFPYIDAFFSWFANTHGPHFVGHLIEWRP